MHMKVNYILFTDGSVRRLRTGECISGYGIVVVDTTTKQYTCFGGDIRTTSIVYAEAWAIYRGLHFISKITKTRNVKPHVLLVSDSKLNVSILGDLIPNTWDLSDWDNWKKKDGTPVLNQELYRDIVELIYDNEMRVRFIHINSHLDDAAYKTIKKKLQEVDVKLDNDIAKLFVMMNNMADETATSITQERKESIRDRSSLTWRYSSWNPLRIKDGGKHHGRTSYYSNRGHMDCGSYIDRH